jgi:hypothetical protein
MALLLHYQLQPCTRQLVSMLSNNFKVLEGLKRTEFMIHSALLASQSPEFDRLINRYLVENKERCASWQHIDVETFIHFSELTYTRAYYGPEAKRRSDTLPSGSEKGEPFDLDWPASSKKKKKKKSLGFKEELRKEERLSDRICSGSSTETQPRF